MRLTDPSIAEELVTRESIPDNTALLQEAEHSLMLWLNAENGGKDLELELERLAKEVEWLSRSSNNNNAPKSGNHICDMKSRIGALAQVREKMWNNIAKLDEEISDAKKKL